MGETTRYEELQGRIRALTITLYGVLSADECREVESFVEHNELGEALRTLVGIIVEEGKRIPSAAFRDVVDLASEMKLEFEQLALLEDHVDG